MAGLLLIDTACGHGPTVAASPMLQVLVTPVKQQDVPIYRDWIGTLDGLVNAEINAQVSGYLIKQPIDGIPGIAQLQVGALVSPASGAITTVSTLFHAQLDLAQLRLRELLSVVQLYKAPGGGWR